MAREWGEADPDDDEDEEEDDDDDQLQFQDLGGNDRARGQMARDRMMFAMPP